MVPDGQKMRTNERMEWTDTRMTPNYIPPTLSRDNLSKATKCQLIWIYSDLKPGYISGLTADGLNCLAVFFSFFTGILLHQKAQNRKNVRETCLFNILM